MRTLINLSIKLITVICVMFRNIYKEPRLIRASFLTMSNYWLPIQFLKRKLSDSSEMPLSYADMAKKPAKAPQQSGSSHGKNHGQSNYNHQAPRGRDDTRNDPPHTSVGQRNSSSSSSDRRPHGQHDPKHSQKQQPYDNSAKYSNNKNRNKNQPWNRGGRDGNKGGHGGKGRGHDSSQTSQVYNQNRSQDHDNSNRSDFKSQGNNWGRGIKLGHAQVNNQNREQVGDKRNSGAFVDEDPDPTVYHRRESESSTTNMSQRSHQNSESDAWSGKLASQPVVMSHSSDSSTTFPCSESTVSEENQASSLPSKSPPPSDGTRKPLAATPVGSHSFSDPPAASETKAETRSPTQSNKPVGWSGPDPRTKGKKKSESKNTAEGSAGPVLTDKKTVESQEPGEGKGVWKGVSINELRRAPECFRECKSQEAEVNESADLQFDRPESQEQHRGKFVRPSFVFLPHQQQPGIVGSSFRWNTIAQILSTEITSLGHLEEVMRGIAYYNPQQDRHHNPQSNPNERIDLYSLEAYFQTLTKEEYNRFFNVTLPSIQALALELPYLFQEPLHILKKQTNQEVTLSQHQVACLLANAFFNTFPKRFYNRDEGKPLQMPDNLNFIKLYSFNKSERKIEKLKCIVNYFERVTTDMPNGNITYKRVYRKPEGWMTLESKLTKLHVSTEGTIEDERGFLQADFANKFVGGGVLNTGLVQEEIRFVLCPEMIVSCLITEMLTDDEVLVMIGCERFSSYTGYSDTFKFAGNFVDTTERDEHGRKYTEVVAMDASVFRNDFYQQFEMKHVIRELNKAHCAFEGSDARLQGSNVQLEGSGVQNLPAVCTGNWGCGAFGGDKQLKALIQLMAASVANRDICYLTFGDSELCLQIGHIYEILKSRNMSIKDIMDILTVYSKSNTSDSLFTFMEKMIYGNVHSADTPNKSQEKSTKSDSPKNTKQQEKPTRSDNPKNTNVQNKSSYKHNK